MKDSHISRSEQAMETKNRIYEVAISLFREKGLDSVTIREICRAAKVSVGLFYNYFDSKEGVFLEYSKRNEGYYRSVRSTFSPGETTLERLLKFAIFNAESGNILEKDAGRFVYIYALRNPTKHFMANIDREVNKTIREIIDYGILRNEIRPDIDKETLHRTIISCGWGCFFAWFSGIEPEVSLEERMINAHKLLYEGISLKLGD